MPILTPDYISTWYYFRDGAGLVRIFENWSETQEQEIEKVSFLQGDIGTHVMNVGGIKWVTNIESPALIVEFDDGSEAITDSFDLLVYAFNYLRDPDVARKLIKEKEKNDTIYIPDYLMRSGRVSIGQEGVKVSMEIVSSVPGAFAAKTFLESSFKDITLSKPGSWPTVNEAAYPHFIARVARFYDVTFYTKDSNQIYSYQVLSADIRINANISENYFINTGSQAPFFGVQGYHVSGELELAVPPEFFPDVLIPQQNAKGQALNVNNASITLSLTGHQNGLVLGSTQLRSKVARSLSPNQISKVTVAFDSYTNYSTIVKGK